MGGCLASKSSKVTKYPLGMIHSPSSFEKNQMKVQIAIDKIDSAPKLRLFDNKLYKRRKSVS